MALDFSLFRFEVFVSSLGKAMKEHNITNIEVSYSGSGDSGSLNDPIYEFSSGNKLKASKFNEEIELLYSEEFMKNLLSWNEFWGTNNKFEPIVEMDNKEAPRAKIHIGDLVEELCYSYLERQHGGWENEGGAEGEFSIVYNPPIDMVTINLNHTEFYTESHTHGHQDDYRVYTNAEDCLKEFTDVK